MTQPTSAAQKVDWNLVGPDLLTALQTISSYREELVGPDGSSESDDLRQFVFKSHSIWVAARAAIARATRESEDV